MKRYIRIIASMLLGGAILGACNGTDYDFSVCEMKVDRDAIVDVAAQNPGQEAVVLTTTAPYWIERDFGDAPAFPPSVAARRSEPPKTGSFVYTRVVHIDTPCTFA